ncbi:MAG: glycosyl hydrolase 115 family protein [Sedimentisphaerales bacterium]|nr:glycosyl hydrolase 115 family protein [Sedimentisphaerales bacterium]
MKMKVKLLSILLLLTATQHVPGFIADNSLVLHLDAQALSHSVANGDNITLWPDSSGNNNPASQDQTLFQPVFIDSQPQFNNMPVVRFDGINDWMAMPSTTMSVGSFTMFAVARYDRISQEQYIVASQDGSGNDRARFATNGSSRFVWRAGSSGEVSTAADMLTHIFASTSEMEAYLDGNHVSENANYSREWPTAFNLGSYNRGQKCWFKGDLAEFMVFDRILSTEEINEVGAYLELKYALNTSWRQKDILVQNVSPTNDSQNIPLDKALSWEPARAYASPAYNVYFGTDITAIPLVSQGQLTRSYDPLGSGLLEPETRYFWRVDIQGASEPGEIQTFVTRSQTPLKPLVSDLNEDNVVDIDDLVNIVTPWLETGSSTADIDNNGIVDIADFSTLGVQWGKNGQIQASYIMSRADNNSFAIADNGQLCSIYVDSTDHEVCRIAARLLSEDIERVCGLKPALVNDINAVSGNVIIIGTLGHSAVIDALADSSEINTSDLAGSWETYALETVANPLPNIAQALIITGSDRRGTAYGVFDLSEKMGISPWYWFADAPVKYRENVFVRSGRYKQGPPSVKYRGFFINDEDWGLHPWARNNYSPDDGFIGPKAHKRIFELLLRLKANYLWPAMHKCTKGFHGFAENKIVADQYAIVMGSSHCEQMSRDNEWEWYRWSPADGSPRGDWDWCTNSTGLTRYWHDAVAANGQYENIYTTGMRGIHDSGMPCSGATDAQKVLAMQNEIFPAQRNIIAELVNPDVTQVPQIFCPYKEVLGLYNMGMNVPDDITLVWPDDNHGYIRRLSNTSERARSGSSGVYYHFSYLGSPRDFLWLYSTPPALIWEEMTKAYQYGADRVWVFNVGDIKPAEIGIDYAFKLAWDISQFPAANVREYLEFWAWQQFGPEHRDEIADILIEYFNLAQARKPEHMTMSGLRFNMNDFGDELERRIDHYEQITLRANAVYNSLTPLARDAFYQMVLYQVRCAGLMNKKILYSQKNAHYAAQGRISANNYALMATEAYNQILAETDYYNNTMSRGKWKGIMSCKPLNRPEFGLPAMTTVTPLPGPDMGIALEGQGNELVNSPVAYSPFADDFDSGNSQNWLPLNSSRWTVRANGSQNEYAINTSDYSNLSGDRLGELALVKDHVYDYFNFKCQVRSCDNLNSNNSADLALVFGYQNDMNYYYILLCSDRNNSALHCISNGTRTLLQNYNVAVPDNLFHALEVLYDADGLTVNYNGQQLTKVTGVFPAGMVGLGAYNDSAAFTAVDITPVAGSITSDMLPEFDVFTKNSHFIDIFNKGDAAFNWSAQVSEPWILLDSFSGSVSSQQRLWASIDWNIVPTGSRNGIITITGPHGNLQIKVKSFKPASPRPEDITGFVESRGFVSMEAENYTNRTDKGSAGWRVIPTLGSTRDSITVLPVTQQSRTDIADIMANSPMVEYQVYLWNDGEKTVTVRAIPTHAITSEHKLRYAVAFDDQLPVLVDYDTSEWSSQWNLNVLQGVALSNSVHTISSPGSHTLKVWMVDPGVVLDKIIIGNPSTSHLGPMETTVKP